MVIRVGTLRHEFIFINMEYISIYRTTSGNLFNQLMYSKICVLRNYNFVSSSTIAQFIIYSVRCEMKYFNGWALKRYTEHTTIMKLGFGLGRPVYQVPPLANFKRSSSLWNISVEQAQITPAATCVTLP